jgi:hypothetical protein
MTKRQGDKETKMTKRKRDKTWQRDKETKDDKETKMTERQGDKG